MPKIPPVLALLLTLVLVTPVLAQTSRQTTKPPVNTPGVNRSIKLNIPGIFGRIFAQVGRQGAQQATQNNGQPVPNPASANNASTTGDEAGAEYRMVMLPPLRPNAFDGRPLLIDAEYDPDTVLVMLQPDASDPAGEGIVGKIRRQLGLKILGRHQYGLNGVLVVRCYLPMGLSVEEVLMAFMSIPGVVGVQPQYIYRAAQGSASADLKALQYAPERLNALVAREAGDGTGVTIGLIDTGIDLNQPELMGADIETFDVMEERPVRDRDHGTALAGLMLAHSGLDGIAPGAHLISVRAFDDDASGGAVSGSYEIAAAIDLAVEKGARVINLSFAGPRDPLVMSVLDAAAAKGVILVAAAGNGGPEAAPAYPGAHRDAVAVTATDSRDNLFSAANRGYYIAVAAPGVDVLSPMPDARFELLSGTSIATAHISAIVALMLEHDPDLTREEVVNILEASARDLGAPGQDTDFGAGLADAAAAVAAVGQ